MDLNPSDSNPTNIPKEICTSIYLFIEQANLKLNPRKKQQK